MKINTIVTKLTAALALLIASCFNVFSQDNTNCVSGVDLSQYTTYDFRPGRSYNQGLREKPDKAKDKKVNNSVAAQLNEKGLRQSSVNPDLIVTYAYGEEEVSNVEIKAPMYAGPVFFTPEGIWAGTWTNWWVRTSDVGTLVIDVRDATTNKLVYRVHGTGDVKRTKKQQKEFNRIAEKGFVCFRK